jgi:ubiquinone/menaquinone biosynthesis C-methylase UbiE
LLDNDNHWECQARNWLRWARTPGFDSYWYYRDVFFDGIVPPPQCLTLDMGCGEGRVTRDLVQRGHNVIGVDTSLTLVREAGKADTSSKYLNANGKALPFPDGAFSLVVAYNTLMDMDDMPAALSEASRVLQLQGRLAVCVTHPISDAGKFTGTDPHSPFVISGSYLGQKRLFDQNSVVRTCKCTSVAGAIRSRPMLGL